MKQCKDCKWDKISMEERTARGQYACYLCMNCGSTKYYWTAKILLITLALLLGGCSHTTATYKDGVATVRRTRILMTEDIGSFSYDATDGSFTLDGYKSDMTRALILIDKLAKKEGDEKKVKP